MSPTEDEKVEKLLTMSAKEMGRIDLTKRLGEKRLKQK
jgi:hypothetical protein